MENDSKKDLPWTRAKRHWVSSLGVQIWLVDASKLWIATHARELADTLVPSHPSRFHGGEVEQYEGHVDTNNPLPRSSDTVRNLIAYLRNTILQLDDVKDFSVIENVDNDMYELWKELERKMQRHRRSEAKHQLKNMFRI